MNIGVPKETAANERRVALTPDVAGRLVKAGFSVLVERGAGEAASFGDDAFGAAGATLVATAAEVFGQSDIVLKVQPPSAQEVRLSREGGALVALFQPSADRGAGRGGRWLCEAAVRGDPSPRARLPRGASEGRRRRDHYRGHSREACADPDHGRRRPWHETGLGDRGPGGRNRRELRAGGGRNRRTAARRP